jgi:hypothetical protein
MSNKDCTTPDSLEQHVPQLLLLLLLASQIPSIRKQLVIHSSSFRGPQALPTALCHVSQ